MSRSTFNICLKNALISRLTMKTFLFHLSAFSLLCKGYRSLNESLIALEVSTVSVGVSPTTKVSNGVIVRP